MLFILVKIAKLFGLEKVHLKKVVRKNEVKYCVYCGAEIHDEAVICVKCGRTVKQEKIATVIDNNSKLLYNIITSITTY